MRHPTEDGIARRNTPSPSTTSSSTEDTADSWPGGYKHLRSHNTVRTNKHSSHIGSRSTCADFGVVSCGCCEAKPQSIGAKARAKANTSGMGAGATRVGSEARHRRRFLRFEEANLCSISEEGHVGTVASRHVSDDINCEDKDKHVSFSEASLMICSNLRLIFPLNHISRTFSGKVAGPIDGHGDHSMSSNILEAEDFGSSIDNSTSMSLTRSGRSIDGDDVERCSERDVEICEDGIVGRCEGSMSHVSSMSSSTRRLPKRQRQRQQRRAASAPAPDLTEPPARLPDHCPESSYIHGTPIPNPSQHKESTTTNRCVPDICNHFCLKGGGNGTMTEFQTFA